MVTVMNVCRNGALPRMVYMSRERKWLNMFSNWDYWMSKKFFKVMFKCACDIKYVLR